MIATLLFFLKSPSEAPADSTGLKPSQLDFTESNQPKSNTEDVVGEVTTTTVPATTPESISKLSASDAAKIQVLDEILKSKNDNDPRMDQELKVMSRELHEALYDKYDMMTAENRNGRGTVAFLIARDLKSAEDAQFLKQVFDEAPCTSMANCGQVSQEDSHLGGVEQNSLNYPQLATLYQIESRIEQNPHLLKDQQYRGWVSEVIRQAKRFPVPIVKDKAEQMAQKYGL